MTTTKTTSHWTYGVPVPYEAPNWAKRLQLRPKNRIQMAQLPTPIYRWNLPGVPDEFQVFIKRDDMTGSTITGNKARKLEFALADAVAQGCDSIVTIGGTCSNHARSTAVAARELGLEPHLLMITDNYENPDSIAVGGNMILDRLAGAKIILYPFPYDDHFPTIARMLSDYCNKLRSEGKKPYSSPAGGSSGLGCWGYIEAFREMMEQGVYDNIDDIVVCTGTGGTVTGLAVANYLTGSKLKIHAFSIAVTAKEVYDQLNRGIAELGVFDETGSLVEAEDLVNVNSDYVGGGFSESVDEDRELIAKVASKTGIFLDRIFTLKPVKGMLSEMTKNPTQFKGPRVLFIHTGGMLGLLDGGMDEFIKTSAPETNKMFTYKEILPSDIKY